MKVKILGKDRIIIVYTKDVYDQETLALLTDLIQSINWATADWAVLPSEYIKKIKFKKR